jgi:hypothetical protein
LHPVFVIEKHFLLEIASLCYVMRQAYRNRASYPCQNSSFITIDS